MSAATGRAEERNASLDQAHLGEHLTAPAKNGIEYESLSQQLIRAAAAGDHRLVSGLLDLGADVNAKRHDGFTPLLLAAFFGHFEVVRLLVERGADVGLTSRFGTSAEMWATSRGFKDICAFLRETTSGARRFELPSVEENLTPEVSEYEGTEVDALLNEPRFDLDCEVTLVKPSSSPIMTGEGEDLDERVQSHVEETTGEQQVKPRRVVRVLDESWEAGPLIELSTARHQPGIVFAERITARRTSLILIALVVTIASAVVTYAILKMERRSYKQRPAVTASLPETNSPAAPEQSASDISKTVELSASGSDNQPRSADVSSTDVTPSPNTVEETKSDSTIVTTKLAATSRTTARRELAYQRIRTSISDKRKDQLSKMDRNQANSDNSSMQPNAEQRTATVKLSPPNIDTRSRDLSGSPEIVSPNRKTKVIQWP